MPLPEYGKWRLKHPLIADNPPFPILEVDLISKTGSAGPIASRIAAVDSSNRAPSFCSLSDSQPLWRLMPWKSRKPPSHAESPEFGACRSDFGRREIHHAEGSSAQGANGPWGRCSRSLILGRNPIEEMCARFAIEPCHITRHVT